MVKKNEKACFENKVLKLAEKQLQTEEKEGRKEKPKEEAAIQLKFANDQTSTNFVAAITKYETMEKEVEEEVQVQEEENAYLDDMQSNDLPEIFHIDDEGNVTSMDVEEQTFANCQFQSVAGVPTKSEFDGEDQGLASREDYFKISKLLKQKGKILNPIYEELGFTLVKKRILSNDSKKTKYYALCSVCQVLLSNTGAERLRMHRNVCKKSLNQKDGANKTSVVKRNLPKAYQNGVQKMVASKSDPLKKPQKKPLLPDQSQEASKKRPLPVKFSHLPRKALKNLGYSLVQKIIGDKISYKAICWNCKSLFSTIATDQLREHRKQCQEKPVRGGTNIFIEELESNKKKVKAIIRGRPLSKIIEHYSFTPIKKVTNDKTVYVAQCNNCKTQFTNVSQPTLKRHRDACKRKVLESGKDPLALDSEQEECESEKRKKVKRVRGRPRSKPYQEYSFALVKKLYSKSNKLKYFAQCLYCKLFLRTFSVRKMKMHRISCGTKNLNSTDSDEADTLMEPSAKMEPGEDDLTYEVESIKNQEDSSETFTIHRTCSAETRGRKPNTVFKDLGFTLVRKVIGDKRKYYAVCLFCKVPLANTSSRRLIAHRNICNYERDPVDVLKCSDRENLIKVEIDPQGSKKVVGESNYTVEFLQDEPVSDDVAVVLRSQCMVKPGIGRRQNIAFKDFGFTLVRRICDGKRKYWAQCWNCKAQLRNTAAERLKNHRKLCGTANFGDCDGLVELEPLVSNTDSDNLPNDEMDLSGSSYDVSPTLEPSLDSLSSLNMAENWNNIEVQTL